METRVEGKPVVAMKGSEIEDGGNELEATCEKMVRGLRSRISVGCRYLVMFA